MIGLRDDCFGWYAHASRGSFIIGAVEKTLKGIHPLTPPCLQPAVSASSFTMKLRVISLPECKYSVWTDMRRALPQGVVRQCRAVNRHNMFPEVSERMTVVPTTLALFTMKLRWWLHLSESTQHGLVCDVDTLKNLYAYVVSSGDTNVTRHAQESFTSSFCVVRVLRHTGAGQGPSTLFQAIPSRHKMITVLTRYRPNVLELI